MKRKGFIMTVYPDKHDEYEKRHNEIWPEMVAELKKHGAHNYSIFLDKQTNQLFGYIEIEDEEKWSKMAETSINQKWWKFMKPVMKTNSDDSPVSTDLTEVFHMD
ncbi:hypothetical conserved protein [Oceanobacillus iheyensis HTE831]|uniref:L-rhamnose mutarotase n=1 Tax=Oceanobacillus iheyensis (strain DSM 14371 / CIP 107618 / JCM 11309 / KCTC 3954 / HTE831) TaxID=221109 RepID=RHAM_OCEIH|nr:L-rhamnose mutarotase [Oceanobacillus iheyensis]Q8ESX3.1 RecName: Full=L-rhamnose mutarotase; AltName: Full=Rhamnose 1-epimerase; AltName: Full=Type-3 mutarotase [Oceanobacillus iheyensis HTE831]BAC12449.1 hypothetical conserved protein [Oceanobacillus iheyensis HTE831]